MKSPQSVPVAAVDVDKPIANIQYFSEAHSGPGWYYWDDEYPDEGSVGAFKTRKETEAHARDAGYRFEEWDYGSV